MSQASDIAKRQPFSRDDKPLSGNQLLDTLAELSSSKATLEEDRIRNQALLNSLGEGLIVIDQDGIITTINPKAAEILGVTETELLGEWFPRAVQAVDSGGRVIQTLKRPIIQALSQGHAVSGNSNYVCNDGSIIPVASNVAPVVVNGRPVGAIEVFRDITEEQALERAKDEFVSLASHQLRTPATAVKAILAMLVSGDFGEMTPRQKHFITKAISTNDRQLEIIEDMLHAARIDAGKMQLSLETVELVGMCNEVVREQLRDIESRKQTINIRRPSQELFVKADATKLRMVLENLISNAHKYTPNGGRIDIRTVVTTPTVRVEVADTGVGIKKSDLNKLFDKFSRIDNQLSAKVGGSGLGLYLVKHIINLHEGNIHVESKLGEGSTFTVELPMLARSKAL